MFAWLKAEEVDAAAKKLVDDFIKRYPVELEKEQEKANPNRLQQALHEFYVHAVKFRQERKLGLYKKAKLANSVKWRLKESGYSDALVDEIVRTLALKIAGRIK